MQSDYGAPAFAAYDTDDYGVDAPQYGEATGVTVNVHAGEEEDEL